MRYWYHLSDGRGSFLSGRRFVSGWFQVVSCCQIQNVESDRFNQLIVEPQPMRINTGEWNNNNNINNNNGCNCGNNKSKGKGTRRPMATVLPSPARCVPPIHRRSNPWPETRVQSTLTGAWVHRAGPSAVSDPISRRVCQSETITAAPSADIHPNNKK